MQRLQLKELCVYWRQVLACRLQLAQGSQQWVDADARSTDCQHLVPKCSAQLCNCKCNTGITFWRECAKLSNDKHVLDCEPMVPQRTHVWHHLYLCC